MIQTDLEEKRLINMTVSENLLIDQEPRWFFHVKSTTIVSWVGPIIKIHCCQVKAVALHLKSHDYPVMLYNKSISTYGFYEILASTWLQVALGV